MLDHGQKVKDPGTVRTRLGGAWGAVLAHGLMFLSASSTQAPRVRLLGWLRLGTLGSHLVGVNTPNPLLSAIR